MLNRAMTLPLLALAGALGGCATAGDEGAAESVSSDCLYVRSIDDFRVLDDRNLIIYAPSRRSPYHVQLLLRCTSLRFAHQLGVDSRDSRLCGYGGDAIIVDEHPTPRRCTIDKITALSPGEHDALLVRYGQLKDATPPAEPEESVETPAGEAQESDNSE